MTNATRIMKSPCIAINNSRQLVSGTRVAASPLQKISFLPPKTGEGQDGGCLFRKYPTLILPRRGGGNEKLQMQQLARVATVYFCQIRIAQPRLLDHPDGM